MHTVDLERFILEVREVGDQNVGADRPEACGIGLFGELHLEEQDDVRFGVLGISLGIRSLLVEDFPL